MPAGTPRLARWAPSAQNSQPWRFLVTRRGEEAHDQLFAALAPGNRAWAGTASALVLVAARTVGDEGDPQPWALYDTGQAVAALVTQAQADGLAVHQMGGFDTAAVRAEFGLGDDLTPVVVGNAGRYQDQRARRPGPGPVTGGEEGEEPVVGVLAAARHQESPRLAVLRRWRPAGCLQQSG